MYDYMKAIFGTYQCFLLPSIGQLYNYKKQLGELLFGK